MVNHILISEISIISLDQDMPLLMALMFATFVFAAKMIFKEEGWNKYLYILVPLSLLMSIRPMQRVKIFFDFNYGQMNSFEIVSGNVQTIESINGRKYILTIDNRQIISSPYGTSCLFTKFSEIKNGDKIRVTYSSALNDESDCIVKIEKLQNKL